MKRSVVSQRLQWSFVAMFLLLPIFGVAADKHKAEKGRSAVTIENFGKVNDHIYRGGQPEGDEYRQLVALGIKTIVDLRGDSERGARAAAESAGLRYVNLPMEPKRYPEADAAQRFLAIVNDEANGPYYVHCAGGKHRTGVMIAVYRMEVDKWDIERAYQEMKDYDFYTRMGHGCYKDYIFDYSRNLQAQSETAPAIRAKAIPASSQHK
ncbi:MAG: tyrosine-protein phosphatase [Acidobacteria bacterium]|nr:tyrosine-protein phosphatase [Acidobacteriota bacterium]